MCNKETATLMIRATEIFNDYFNREPDMHNVNDVMELLCIQEDIIYAMQNINMRNENKEV